MGVWLARDGSLAAVWEENTHTALRATWSLPPHRPLWGWRSAYASAVESGEAAKERDALN